MRQVENSGMNKFGFVLLLSLVCVSLGAQEKLNVQWLYSMEADFKSGLTSLPKTQSYSYEFAVGARFNQGVQCEIPVIAETKCEWNGDAVLSRHVLSGIAVGYHWGESFLEPVTVKISAVSCLTKGAFPGAEINAKAQFFWDKSEQAFLSLGGGRYVGYHEGPSSWIIQAGLGFRIKRSSR